MPKRTITTPTVLTSTRPFSNAVRAGNGIYVAGQLPVDREGNTIGAGDVGAQTRQVLTNIRALVEAAGGTLQDVVKTTVYLTDMANHGPMNEVYREFFPSEFPARTTVEVSALAPAMKGEGRPFLVEIDAVAIVADHRGDE
jgi:2-iminobutanoate/2-iminopropanoate deaminase